MGLFPACLEALLVPVQLHHRLEPLALLLPPWPKQHVCGKGTSRVKGAEDSCVLERMESFEQASRLHQGHVWDDEHGGVNRFESFVPANVFVASSPEIKTHFRSVLLAATALAAFQRM